MSKRGYQFLFLLPIGFLVVFFLYPILSILQRSLQPAAFVEVVQKASFAKVLWFTLWQAVVSTLLTLLVALPAAYLFGRFRFPGKTALRALSTVPFVMPTVVVATAFRALLGPRGWVNLSLQSLFDLPYAPLDLERTVGLILLAHVFYNYAVVVRIVGGYWSNLSQHTEEAASVLGANRWRVFRLVTLPALMPAIVTASLLIFLFTFTSFGVILILGGPGFSTLETEIYRQAMSFLDLPSAAVLSVIQIFITYGVMLAYSVLSQRSTVPVRFQARRELQKRPSSPKERIFLIINVLVMLVLLISPLAALVGQSFQDSNGEFSLRYYLELNTNRRGSVLHLSPLAVIANSLKFALVTVILATVLGTLAAWMIARNDERWGPLNRAIDALMMMPLGVSSVTLGFGYIVALGVLRTWTWLTPLAHTLIAFPFVVRSTLPVLRGIQPALRESAAILGASPGRVWREIDLPIISRAILVGAVFSFTVSMGEFGATAFIVRPGSSTTTLPIAINRLLGQPGAMNFGQALALGTILMIICAVSFTLIERFRYGDIGEF